jgi:hypothetical protein
VSRDPHSEFSCAIKDLRTLIANSQRQALKSPQSAPLLPSLLKLHQRPLSGDSIATLNDGK